jgi:hypothetical protein
MEEQVLCKEVDLNRKRVACNRSVACFLCHVQRISIDGYLQ